MHTLHVSRECCSKACESADLPPGAGVKVDEEQHDRQQAKHLVHGGPQHDVTDVIEATISIGNIQSIKSGQDR